jgi:tetratricopeptide (TPR) repeat protein
MKRIIISVLALGVCLTPMTVPLMVQPTWGQSQNSQVQEVERLIQQATQQQQQGQHRQAIETWQQVLGIARQIKDREMEALALNDIGSNYDSIAQPQEALKYYNQALPITREVGDRAGVAATLNNIGLVYNRISQPQEALKYFNQALPIQREVGDRAGLATTLNNIGLVYLSISQPQEALKYYNQALPIIREVGDRSVEAATLSGIGAIYQDMKQPTQTIENWEQSVNITLEIRSGLQRKNRQTFLQSSSKIGTPIALLDKQTKKYLIQKYPVNYLTRISTRSIPDSTVQGGILALGNPVTRDPYNLPASPDEVKNITQIFPGSLSYVGNAATLDQFKTQASRFPFLHLATHGCFQPEGCCLPNSPNCRKPDRLDLQPNTILFIGRRLF